MKYFILFLFFLLFPFILLSQVTNPEWRNYTNSETTRSIAEEGIYIWLATDGGMVRMDQTSLQKSFFNKGNTILPSNHITSVIVDGNGYKWLCTNNGLVKFKDDDWSVYKMNNSGLPENRLTCITLDNDGNKWIGTLDSGLVMFDGVNWTVYNHLNSSLGSDQIRDLNMGNDGLWIGTYNGLYKRENNNFVFISVLGTRHISCIEKDIHGDTWVGTTSGLFKLIGMDTVTTFSSLSITSLGIDNHNVKWFGSANDISGTGAMRNIDSADTQITLNNLVNSITNYPWFSSMLLEPSGVKWFGSANGLVKAIVTAEFINISNSALGRDYVTKLFIDNNNRKWFYAWGGIPLTGTLLPPGYLASLSDDTWTSYNLDNSPVDITGVAAVAGYYGADMFIAVYGYWGNTELYHYSSGNWEQITVPQTQYDLILDMWFDDATGELWVDFEGANGDNNLFIYYYDFDYWIAVPDYPVYDINKMKRLNNVLWIASPQGLIKYQSGSFSLYNTSNSGLPNNNVSSVDFDSAGNVWAGTGGGLVKFDGTNWIVYDRYNSPLSCDNISGLAIDPSGNIFLGTKSIGYPNYIAALGLVKFDGTNWTFLNSDNSGFPDVSYGGWNVNDLSIDASGKIWIATQGGVGVYDKDGVPVPVELVSFNAGVSDNNVQLSWTTATETNNKGFDIERHIGSKQYAAGNWETVGFVEGNGTTTQPKSYSFSDNAVKPGRCSYRLKQIDFDGSFKYSKEVEVSIGSPDKFTLSQNYPNPFNPVTTIKYQIPDDNFVTLRIYNALGEEVATPVNEYRPAGSYEIKFDAAKLSSGVYFYQIKAGEYTAVKKMILLR